MNENQKHVFQILTKRADILLQHSDKLNWTSNIWMGVTVENTNVLTRIDLLRKHQPTLNFCHANRYSVLSEQLISKGLTG